MPTGSRRDGRPGGRHLIGNNIRSSHLGYDCYLTGIAGSSNGQVRIVLRPIRVPQTIPQSYRAILPELMWWPQRDHAGAHGCVDAVMTQDHKSLESWKRTWPSHQFGFENFLVWCQRAAANGLRSVEPTVSDLVPRFGRHGQPQAVYVPPTFPVGREKHRDLVRRIPMEGYVVKIYVVTFKDLTKALRTDVLGILGDERILLGRAYVDLIDNHFQVIEHHPGHCEALDLPKDLIYRTLGVRAPSDVRGTITQDLPNDDRGERPLTPRQRSMQVTMKAAELAGQVVDAPLEPQPTPRRREPEIDFTVFPEAPGMAGGRSVAPTAG